MPDLRAIVDRALGIVPHLYLRDHVGDTGETPNGGRRYSSPDIIVTGKKTKGEMNDSYGQGKPNEDTLVPETGQVNDVKKILVRARNRGLKDAVEVNATIYGAPRSTLLTPDRWTEASAKPPEMKPVAQGDLLKLSEAVKWDPQTQGSEKLEHSKAALVAVVNYNGGEDGPVPCHPSDFNWPRFLSVMRRQRNVAVRNVAAVDLDRPATIQKTKDGEESVPLKKFWLNGTPDAPRIFEFEVLQQLPESVSVKLTAPLGVALFHAGVDLFSDFLGRGQGTHRDASKQLRTFQFRPRERALNPLRLPSLPLSPRFATAPGGCAGGVLHL